MPSHHRHRDRYGTGWPGETHTRRPHCDGSGRQTGGGTFSPMRELYGQAHLHFSRQPLLRVLPGAGGPRRGGRGRRGSHKPPAPPGLHMESRCPRSYDDHQPPVHVREPGASRRPSESDGRGRLAPLIDLVLLQQAKLLWPRRVFQQRLPGRRSSRPCGSELEALGEEGPGPAVLVMQGDAAVPVHPRDDALLPLASFPPAEPDPVPRAQPEPGESRAVLRPSCPVPPEPPQAPSSTWTGAHPSHGCARSTTGHSYTKRVPPSSRAIELYLADGTM